MTEASRPAYSPSMLPEPTPCTALPLMMQLLAVPLRYAGLTAEGIPEGLQA